MEDAWDAWEEERKEERKKRKEGNWSIGFRATVACNPTISYSIETTELLKLLERGVHYSSLQSSSCKSYTKLLLAILSWSTC